jgi:hypothetical protein
MAKFPIPAMTQARHIHDVQDESAIAPIAT